MPKMQLHELEEKARPRKIYEKLMKNSLGTSLEDVMAEKRSQAIKFIDDSMFKVKKLDTKAALNEDSLTEPSVGREMDREIFHTVCHPS